MSCAILLFLVLLAGGSCGSVVDNTWHVHLFLVLPPTSLFWVALYYIWWVYSLLSLIECHWCNSKGLLSLSKMIDSGAGAEIKFALNGKISMLDKAVEQIKQGDQEP